MLKNSLIRWSSSPISRVEFVNEFSEMRYEKLHTDKPGKQRKKDLKLGEPFEPSGVYNVLPVMKTSENMFARGKQEDAEEFLTCLLNKLHEEMAEAVKQHKKKLAEGEQEHLCFCENCSNVVKVLIYIPSPCTLNGHTNKIF